MPRPNEWWLNPEGHIDEAARQQDEREKALYERAANDPFLAQQLAAFNKQQADLDAEYYKLGQVKSLWERFTEAIKNTPARLVANEKSQVGKKWLGDNLAEVAAEPYNAWQAGKLAEDVAEFGYKASVAGSEAERVSFLNQAHIARIKLDAIKSKQPQQGWLKSGALSLIEMTPALLTMGREAAVFGSGGLVAGGAMGSVVPGVGTVAGGITGATGGAYYGASSVAWRQEAGRIYYELSDLKTKDGERLPEYEKQLLSVLGGAAAAGLTFAQGGSLFKAIPGMGGVANAAARKLGFDATSQLSTAKAVMKGLSMWGAETAFQTGANAAQAGISAGLVEAGKIGHGEMSEGQEAQWGNISRAFNDAVAQGALPMAALSFIPALPHFNDTMLKVQRAGVVKETLLQLADIKRRSNALRSDAAGTEKMMGTVAQGTPEVLISAPEFMGYYQSIGVDPYKQAELIGVSRAALDEAVVRGGFVEGDTAKFAANTGSEAIIALSDHTKFDHDDITMSEREKLEKQQGDVGALLQSNVPVAGKKADADFGAVRSDIIARRKETGAAGVAAEANADVMTRMLASNARALGMNLGEYYREFSPGFAGNGVTNAPEMASGMVKSGDKGRNVKLLQSALNNAGYDVKADGVFGDGTKAALVDFQKRNGLNADGVAGKDSFGALGVGFGAKSGGGFESFIAAIGGQESGGDYSAQNASGAYGKYQIMPENWPEWSREVFGEVVEQSPENQEKVARFKLKQYYDKYGARGAAQAWYGGEGAVGKDNIKGYAAGDPTVGEYADQVLARMGDAGESAERGAIMAIPEDAAGLAEFAEQRLPELPEGEAKENISEFLKQRDEAGRLLPEAESGLRRALEDVQPKRNESADYAQPITNPNIDANTMVPVIDLTEEAKAWGGLDNKDIKTYFESLADEKTEIQIGDWLVNVLRKSGYDAIAGKIENYSNHITQSSFKVAGHKLAARKTALAEIQKILSGSVFVEAGANKKAKDVNQYLRFFTPVKIGDRMYSFQIVAELGNRTLLVEPNKVALYDVLPVKQNKTGLTPTAQAVTVPSPVAEISIHDLISGVKDMDGNVYFQNGANRGSYDPAARVISLLAAENRSTFFHELAHFQLDELSRIAMELEKRGDMSDAGKGLVKDWELIKKWLGAEGWEKMSLEERRPLHEKFARSFERYLYEGVAPSTGLLKVFRNIKRWLKDIYFAADSIIREAVTPEVKEVFDRMLASDAEIDDATAFFDYKAQLTGNELFAADRKRYEELQVSSKELAKEDLLAALCRDLSEDGKKRFEREKARIEKEVKELFDKSPERMAAKELKPEMSDAERDGLAMKYGFDNWSECERAIAAVDDESAALFDERITEFEPLINPENIKRRAREAVHNESRMDALAMERQAFFDKAEGYDAPEGTVEAGRRAQDAKLSAWAIRQAAKDSFGSKSVGQALRFAGFFSDERRWGKIADVAANKARALEIAAAKLDSEAKAQKLFEARKLWAEAQQAKDRQILNNALALEAVQFRNKQERDAAFFAKYSKLKPPKVGVYQLNVINRLLFQFGLVDGENRRVQAALLDSKASIRDFFVKANNDAGLAMVKVEEIPDWLQRELPWNELSVDQWNELKAVVDNVDKYGRNEKAFFTESEFASIDDAAMTLHATAVTDKRFKLYGHSDVSSRQLSDDAERALAMDKFVHWNLKVETMLKVLDSNKEEGAKQGVWYESFALRMNKAANEFRRLKYDSDAAFRKLFSVYSKDDLKDMRRRQFNVRGFGHALNKEEILCMALNWGCEKNRDRLMKGWKFEDGDKIIQWNQATIEEALNNLDKRDWDFVQGVWDEIGKYWPAMQKLERETIGVEPLKESPMPVKTHVGTYRGGYFPLSRDKALMPLNVHYETLGGPEGGFRPNTQHGHLMARSDYKDLSYPVRVDFGVINEHVHAVQWDLAYRKAIIDMSRLLNDERVKEGIFRCFGPSGFREFDSWLRDCAAGGPKREECFLDDTLRAIRQNVVFAGIGYNLSVNLQQVTDLFAIAQNFGHINTARAFRGAAANFGEWNRLANEKSIYMKTLAEHLDRDLGEMLNEMQSGSNPVKRHAFTAMAFMDKLISVPVWAEAYNQAIARGLDEVRAVDHADSFIRARFSGDVKDQARVLRTNNEVMKTLSMFMSYGNSLFNIAYLKYKTGTRAEFIGCLAMLFVVGPLVNGLIAGKYFQRKNPEDFWKDPAKEVVGTMFQPFPFIREAAEAGMNMLTGESFNPRGLPSSELISALGDSIRGLKRYTEGKQDLPRTTEQVLRFVSMGVSPIAGTLKFKRAAEFTVLPGQFINTGMNVVDAARGTPVLSLEDGFTFKSGYDFYHDWFAQKRIPKWRRDVQEVVYGRK